MTVYYTRDHEWVRIEGGNATVGITDHAQGQLGDVVFVELPQVDREVAIGEAVAVVESVKAASEVYAPLAGRVIERNDALEATPATINADAEGGGWFFKLALADPDQVDQLMDRDAYDKLLETLG